MAADIKAFIAQVLGKITDPGLKTQAEVVLNHADVQAQLKDGVAGQSEIDRQLQALRTQTGELDQRTTDLTTRETALEKWHGELAGWRTQNLELVELGATAKKAGWKPGTPATTPPAPGVPTPAAPENVVTTDQFREHTTNMEQAFLGFQAAQNQLMREHHTMFKEILDITPLLSHPRIREIGLAAVYQDVHKDRLAAHQAATVKTAEDAIRADERKKVLEAQAQMPYPVAGSVGSGSPLDAIGNAAAAKDVVGAAASHYTRLQAERPSA